MHDWVDELTEGQRVLDVGAATGSLRNYDVACMVVAVDSDTNAFRYAYESQTTKHVYGQGEFMPFASGSFDLVLCQHVLEHIENPSLTLSELARILKPNGRLYAAVPNGYGLCDGIYRFVFEGGGHVNRFRKEDLVRLIEETVQVRLVAWQNLYSSFIYLSRLPELGRDRSLQLSPRLRRITRLPEAFVLWFQGSLYWLTRWAGRLIGVNWAIYGWALYFERGRESAVQEYSSFINVCMFCGDGHPADSLSPHFLFYRCPTCNRLTRYFPPYPGVS
jgi:SAM-dependent methyltransferase